MGKIKQFFVKRTNRFILLTSLFFALMLSFMNSHFLYKIWEVGLPIGGTNISIERVLSVPYSDIERFTHQFNIRKAFLKRGYTNQSDSLNIELSSDDVKAFQRFYFDSTQIEGLRYGESPGGINRGYLVDEINFWRDADVFLPGLDKQKIKIKIHGTSPSPTLKSISVLNRVKRSFTNTAQQNDFDISRAGFAFKLKIKSKEPYYEGMRRLNLLSPWDDWEILGNGVNKYIKEFGVITTAGDIKRLFINGLEVGPYLLVENINKELLERDFKITNFAIFKNNDDWNKGKSSAHNSTTDYTSHDMESSGIDSTIRIAQGKLYHLMNAILEEDTSKVMKYIDVDNLARISALITLTGRMDPLFGDNTKYIYDFASGKFQLGYRLESGVLGINSKTPASFDRRPFSNETHKLLTLFVKERWFIEKRNLYLQKIIDDRERLLNIIQEDYKNFSRILSNSNYPTRKFKFKYSKSMSNLRGNFVKINNYLSYAKIYTTLINDGDRSFLSILHDSYTPSSIISLESCSNEKYFFEEPLLLRPSEYDPESGLINIETSEIKLEIPFDCLLYIEAHKKYSNESIKNKNIYISYSDNFIYIDESNLPQFSSSLELSVGQNTEKTYTLRAGDYVIEEDVIFPYGANVILEPGVNIKIGKNKSIFIRGDLHALGTQSNPISISPLYEGDPFGSFAILGTVLDPSNVDLKYFNLGGGSEDIIEGTYFSGQLSIHYSNTSIMNSKIKDSFSDDGLNIKFSNVEIIDSEFFNNTADQIDIDYSQGRVINNKFYFNKLSDKEFITDGLDTSGSMMVIKRNIFSNMSDKGISIGESSKAIIIENNFYENNNAIAVKDNSNVCINSNSYEENYYDLNAYIKKKMYDIPTIFYEESNGLNINENQSQQYEITKGLNLDCKDWINENL